jgi:hypothetical protein
MEVLKGTGEKKDNSKKNRRIRRKSAVTMRFFVLFIFEIFSIEVIINYMDEHIKWNGGVEAMKLEKGLVQVYMGNGKGKTLRHWARD